jgi:hypothetical protein
MVGCPYGWVVENIGIGSDGWILVEESEAVVERNRYIKQ